MQTTIRKRTARISVVGLILLLGLAYPVVTFAASGSGTPPSTLHTCTKVRKGSTARPKCRHPLSVRPVSTRKRGSAATCTPGMSPCPPDI